MATRKKSAPKEGRFRLTAAEIADVDDSRHQKGMGESRKGLFYWLPTVGKTKKGTFLIMPEIKARGPQSLRTWYFAHGIHRVKVEDDSERGFHTEGKPCWDHMQTEQPMYFSRFIGESDLTAKDCRCFWCEFKKAFMNGKDCELPLQTAPNGVTLQGRHLYDQEVNFNFPVLLPEGEYEKGDEHLVKIHPARISVVKAIAKKLAYYPDLLDPSFNLWVDVELQDKRYVAEVVTPDLAKQRNLSLWLEDWESQVPDLEEKVVNLTPWSYDQQRAFMEEHEKDLMLQWKGRTGQTVQAQPKARSRRKK